MYAMVLNMLKSTFYFFDKKTSIYLLSHAISMFLNGRGPPADCGLAAGPVPPPGPGAWHGEPPLST